MSHLGLLCFLESPKHKNETQGGRAVKDNKITQKFLIAYVNSKSLTDIREDQGKFWFMTSLQRVINYISEGVMFT